MEKHFDGAWDTLIKVPEWHFHSASKEGIWSKKIQISWSG